MPRHRQQEFLCVSSARSERSVARWLDIHVILDNYATHSHPVLKAWLARHPRVQFRHFEDAYNTITWHMFGHTEGGEILTPAGGGSLTWYRTFNLRDGEGVSVSRSFAFNLHDKLENEWTVEQVPDRAQFMAMSSIICRRLYRPHGLGAL